MTKDRKSTAGDGKDIFVDAFEDNQTILPSSVFKDCLDFAPKLLFLFAVTFTFCTARPSTVCKYVTGTDHKCRTKL